MIKRFFLIFAFGLGINALYAENDTNAFTVIGKFFTPNNNLPNYENTTNIADVTFYRNQDQWKMLFMPVKVLPFESIPSKPTEYGMVDTTNTYKNYHFNLSPEKASINQHSLDFYAGSVPEGANILWFSFWGGTYLNGKESGKMIESPFPSPSDHERRMEVKAEWKIHDENALFPMVESYTSYLGEKRWIFDNTLRKNVLTPISKKNQGLPDVNYQVLEWTNVLGQDFPLKAVVKAKMLSAFEKKETINTNFIFLEIETITPGIPENIFEINVLPKTSVSDKRVYAEGNIPVRYSYLSENGKWKSLDEIKADPEMKELTMGAIMDEDLKAPSPWRKVFIVILITLTFGLFFLFLRRSNSSTKS